MDYLLKSLAILLLIAGVPFFLGLGTFLGASLSLGPPGGDSQEAMTKLVLVYAAFALAGLVSAAGGVLWAVTRMAYPPRDKWSELGAVNTRVTK